MIKKISLGIAILFLHTLASAEINFQISFSPIANMIYQLDCISGSTGVCSLPFYQNLWDKNILEGEEDRARLEEWKQLRDRYRHQFSLGDSQMEPLRRPSDIDMASKFRIASFQSSSVEDFLRRLELLVSPIDQRDFARIVSHFYSKFEKWWRAEARIKGKSFSKDLNRLLARTDVRKTIQQFAHFYGVSPSESLNIYLTLFYRPDGDGSSYGQQIEKYSLMEFSPSEKAEYRFDVVIHELCHFFLQSTDFPQWNSLVEKFNNTKKIEARSAYTLLDETLAAALGNGVITRLMRDREDWEEYLSRDQSFYNNYFIDKGAKGILPWLEQWISEGKTLFDPSFATNYLGKIEKIFGSELRSPQVVLRQMMLVADNSFGEKFSPKVREIFKPSRLSYSEGNWSDERLLQDYRQQSDISGLIIVHPKNLTQLKSNKLVTAKEFDKIRAHYKAENNALYSFKRTPTAMNYIVLAPDYDRAVGLIEKLRDTHQGFLGIYSEEPVEKNQSL